MAVKAHHTHSYEIRRVKILTERGHGVKVITKFLWVLKNLWDNEVSVTFMKLHQLQSHF